MWLAEARRALAGFLQPPPRLLRPAERPQRPGAEAAQHDSRILAEPRYIVLVQRLVAGLQSALEVPVGVGQGATVDGGALGHPARVNARQRVAVALRHRERLLRQLARAAELSADQARAPHPGENPEVEPP